MINPRQRRSARRRLPVSCNFPDPPALNDRRRTSNFAQLYILNSNLHHLSSLPAVATQTPAPAPALSQRQRLLLRTRLFPPSFSPTITTSPAVSRSHQRSHQHIRRRHRQRPRHRPASRTLTSTSNTITDSNANAAAISFVSGVAPCQRHRERKYLSSQTSL